MSSTGIGRPLPFLCDPAQVTVSNSSIMCQHGSVCTVQFVPQFNETMQTCTCPDGYVHDFTLGHFPNCGLPLAALPAMFGVLTVITALAWMIAVPAFRQLRARMKVVTGVLMAHTMVNWSFFLSVWIDQGFYVASAALVMIGNIMINFALVELTLITSAPIYAMTRKSTVALKRGLRIVWFAGILAQLIQIIFLCIYARDEGPKRFNRAMLAFIFFLFSSIIALCLVILFSALRLKKALTSSSNMGNQQQSDGVFVKAAKKRLNGIIQSTIIVILLFSAFYAFPGYYFVNSSVPGQYLIFFFLFVSSPCFLIQAIFDFRSDVNENLDQLRNKRLSKESKDSKGSKHSKSTSHVAVAESELQVVSGAPESPR